MTNWATRKNRTISEESVSTTGRASAAAQRGNRAELFPWGRRGQGDPSLSPRIDGAPGVWGRGVFTAPQTSRLTRRRIPAGSPRVTAMGPKELRMAGDFPWRRSSFSCPYWCPTVCPSRRPQPTWLWVPPAHCWRRRGSARVPCQRAHRGEGPASPVSGLLVIGGRWGRSKAGTLLAAIHNHSTSQERGGASFREGYRLRGFSSAKPSLAWFFFFLFTPLFPAAHRAACNTIIGTLATDRPHVVCGVRFFVPAGLSYRFSR